MNIDRLKELHAEMGAILAPRRPEAITAPETGTPIANRAALDAALASAKGGEVLLLAPGHYGNLDWKANYAQPVTIKGGTFGSVKILRHHWKHTGKNAVLDGITSPYAEVNAVNGVTIRGCNLEQLNIKTADDLTIERNWLHDGHFPLRVERSSNFRVIGNVIEGAREDSMRITGDSHHGTVRGNVFLRNMAALPMHADHLQIFGISGQSTCPHDLLIEDNLLHDTPVGKTVVTLKEGKAATPAKAQGFFFAAAQSTMYRNVTIRRNLIRVSMVNAIFTSAGVENFRIEDNIIVPVPGQHIARIVMNKDRQNLHWNNAGTTLARNYTPLIEDESKDATFDGNHVYGTAIEGLFAGMTADAGGDAPEDYRLAEGSPLPAAPWLDGTVATIRATLDAVART